MKRNYECPEYNNQSSANNGSSTKSTNELKNECPKRYRKVPNKTPDGGYGWFIIICSAFRIFIFGGFIKSFSLIFEMIKEKFDASSTQTALVYSICITTNYFTGPFASILVTRFSSRPTVIIGTTLIVCGVFAAAFSNSLLEIYLFLGFMVGIGNGLCGLSEMVCIFKWFEKRRGIAMSLKLSPDGLGAAFIALLITLSFEKYGYSGSLIILSGALLHLYISSASLRDPECYDVMEDFSEKEITESNDPLTTNSTIIDHDLEDKVLEVKSKSTALKDSLMKYFDYNLLGNATFMTFSCMMLFYSMCASTMNTLLAGLCKERGLTTNNVALLLSIMGVISTLSRILSGFIFDLKVLNNYRTFIFTVCGSIFSVLFACAPFAQSILPLFIIFNIHAIANSFFSTQQSLILADIVNKESFPTALGLANFIRGFGVLIGPPLGGHLKDVTGTYDYSFHMAGSSMFISTVLFMIVLICKKTKSDKSKSIITDIPSDRTVEI